MNTKQRLTAQQKRANDFRWYKENADWLEAETSRSNTRGYGDIPNYVRMRVNYDLFNNILNLEDFAYVCKPFGAEAGELPAKMSNKDIISGKIKALLGDEMKRPFSFKVVATNPEATSRKEQEYFNRIKQFTIDYVMLPIQQQAEIKYREQLMNKKLSQDEKEQIMQQMQAEIEQNTPPEVHKYMERQYQDPAEILASQLLTYIVQKERVKNKFNQGFKHGLISGREIYYVGNFNGEPILRVVNPLRFEFDKSPETDFIEDSEWAVAEYRMLPSEVIKIFGEELTNKDIDSIYENYEKQGDPLSKELFTFGKEDYYHSSVETTIKVCHCVWKSLRPVKFLSYIDEFGEEQVTVVDEDFQMVPEAGHLKLETEWIPEVYETWKIGKDIYKFMRPVQGQFKDLDNLYHCKLPYYGAVYDNTNAEETSLIDRMKVYQYFYNIVMYRIELLMAADKGKKIMMNINAIPDNQNISLEEWRYMAESSPYVFFNPNEEGTTYNDVNTMVKQLDFSLSSDIAKYIELARYLKTECGRSVGITETVEGQVGRYESVQNTEYNLNQSSNIVEPYFNMHNEIKRNVLEALLEQCKIVYSGSKKRKLAFILDDMSQKMLEVDTELLDNSTYGLFVSDTIKTNEIRETLKQLAQVALQNQKVEFSDVISVIKQDSVAEAEETLRQAEAARRAFEERMQKQQQEAQQQNMQMQSEMQEKQMKHEIDKIILQEEEKRKTEIIKGSMLAASYNPEVDKDKNGVNDFLETAMEQAKVNLDIRKQNLEEQKLEHQKIVDKKKLEIEEKKANKKT